LCDAYQNLAGFVWAENRLIPDNLRTRV